MRVSPRCVKLILGDKEMLKYKDEIVVNINEENLNENVAVATALANETRLKMLMALNKNTYSITELAKHLDVPTSIIVFHMKVLEKVNLIKVLPTPQKSKSTLYLSKLSNTILFSFEKNVKVDNELEILEFDMPIGNYVSINEKTPIGGFNETQFVSLDEPYSTQRFSLQNLYVGRNAYIEYLFPSLNNNTLSELYFSLEICAESPNYNNNYYSDITFWINDVELLTFTSPADFGGRRGILNPSWLPESISQYGQLITISINRLGTYLNGVKVNNLTLENIKLNNSKSLKFSFGNKKGCQHNGGFNIYGKNAGDHPQNIVMKAVIQKDS